MIVHIVHASLPGTVFIRDGHIVNSLVGVLAPHEVVDDLLELQQLPRRGPVLHRHLGPAVELVAGHRASDIFKPRYLHVSTCTTRPRGRRS